MLNAKQINVTYISNLDNKLLFSLMKHYKKTF